MAALTVVSGFQLLRLMVATLVGVYRDRLGAPLAGLSGSWDYAWSIDGWTVALAVVLAGAAGWALVAAGDPGPDRRIDYIWLSDDLAARNFAATTSTASDHRGIAVTVGPAA